MKISSLFLLAVLGAMVCCSFASISECAVIRVKTTGDDTLDGSSWDNAKKTVTAALTAATSGDEIWVAKGTYVERITLKNGVALYGGFTGNETDVALRDSQRCTTTLDGSKGGCVMTIASGTSAKTRLEGFTIRNGSVSGSGGGVSCTSASTITNNIITGNGVYSWYDSEAGLGGGIRASSAFPALNNNCVYGNSPGDDYSGVQPGATDLQLDPQFANLTRGDVHLKASSPCIDTGTNNAPGLTVTDLDGEGRIAETTVDRGADEYWMTFTADKTSPWGSHVFSSGIVTAVFGDSFYVESRRRAAGIRIIKVDHGLSAGAVINVSGHTVLDGQGEVCVAADSLEAIGTGNLTPLLVSHSSLGGGRFFWEPGGNSGQQEIEGATGLNNIGLLVRTWGKFTKTGDSTFTVDNGSGVNVKCVVPEGVTIESAWQFVGVTGISSCEKVGDELHRLLRVRQQSDITPF